MQSLRRAYAAAAFPRPEGYEKVRLLTQYLVDFRLTPDAKTSLRLLTQKKQISEVSTTSKCTPLE